MSFLTVNDGCGYIERVFFPLVIYRLRFPAVHSGKVTSSPTTPHSNYSPMKLTWSCDHAIAGSHNFQEEPIIDLDLSEWSLADIKLRF